MSLLILLCALVLACLSVLLHYECLSLLNRRLARMHSNRTQILVAMLGLLFVHVMEIWLYAGAYLVLSFFPEIGGINADADTTLSVLDTVYYSAMVYTTVGFGDLIPTGRIRLITATEALVGLSLITWSASFTFLHWYESLVKK